MFQIVSSVHKYISTPKLGPKIGNYTHACNGMHACVYFYIYALQYIGCFVHVCVQKLHVCVIRHTRMRAEKIAHKCKKTRIDVVA